MKTNQWTSAPRIALCSAVLATMMMGCSEKQATTRSETLAAQAATAQGVAEPKEAKDILLRMAKFLSQAPRFSVNVQGSYDVLQESGQKIEFGEKRKITVSRPDYLRVEAEHSNGEKQLLLYDGKDITVFSPSENVYAQAPKPGGVDEAVAYFLKDLHMRLPFAMVLRTQFPEEAQRRTQSVDYVEETEIDGTPVHHLAGRTETVDYQVWIAAGAQPLMLKAVLTYKYAEGQPQFRAQFTDWNLSPEIQDSQFAFVPPEGARKIAFLAQLPKIELQGSATSNQTGGQK